MVSFPVFSIHPPVRMRQTDRQRIELPFGATTHPVRSQGTGKQKQAEPTKHDLRIYKLFSVIGMVGMLFIGANETNVQHVLNDRAAAQQADCEKKGQIVCEKAEETSKQADESQYVSYAEWVMSILAGLMAHHFREEEKAAAEVKAPSSK